MILIADSGSTKTDWAFVDDNREVSVVKTQGINPVHQNAETIRTILKEELMAQAPEAATFSAVYYYGSGVRPTEEALMEQLLREALGATRVEAKSDLLGAARALCGHEEGIACILGTGANSCLFNGEHIVLNTPPLGYILGDEGSGAVLGKELLNALYKGVLPTELREAFESECGMTLADVVERVYRRPLANRFLASLSPFIHSHLHVPAMQMLVVDSLRSFVRRNVAPYGRADLLLSAVGSIAYYYEEQLRQAAKEEGHALGRVERSPLQALVAYHTDPDVATVGE